MVLTVICLLFFGLALLGMPLVWSLLATTAGTIWLFGRFYPLKAVFLTFIDGVQPLHLAAIPLFILAGDLISHGGVGRRLIDLARSLLGFLPGGLGVVTVSSCTMFGAISGSAIADSAAVGSVMIPGMTERGYPRPYSAALVATAGTLGILIPPSIPLLVYGFVGQVSVAELFISGIMPGLVFAAALIVLCMVKARRMGVDIGGERPRWVVISKLTITCLPALLMPVIVLGGIYTGIFTPTESAAIAVVYGLFISIVIYREITIRELPQIILRSFITSAVVMIVVGATASLAWLITVEQIPANLSLAISSVAENKYVFLLLLNIALILIGIFLEPLPALILTAPLFIPTAKAFGIDSVHLGLIMTFNLAIGLYTPPVGGTLFVAARIANVGMAAISKELIPMFGIAIIVLLAVTYVEAIPMWLVWLSRG
jgi:C4-dicarboxylate transporter, DctM subunit